MCWAPLGPNPRYCDLCGSSLDTAEAIRLTELDRDLAALSSHAAMLSAERGALVERIRRLQPRPPTPMAPVPSAGLPPPPPGAAALHASEWRPESLGVMLLWAGVALLALASLIFAVVAWPSIGDLGRLGVLAVATLGVGGAWLGLRERLVLTSEALSALFISMLLVDWQVGYLAAVDGHIDVALWWTIGLILVGGAGVAMGGFAGQRTPRILAGLLVALSGVVLVAGVADSLRFAVVGLMVVVTLLTIAAFVVSKHEAWRGFAISVSLVSASVWVVAFFMALVATLAEPSDGVLLTAGATMTLMVPLVILRVASKRLRTDQALDAVVGFVVAMVAMWSVLVLLAVPADSDSIIVAVAAVGLVVCVVSRVVVGRVSAGWWPGGLLTMTVAAISASTVSVFLLGRLVDALDTGGASFGSSSGVSGASGDALGESVRLLLNLDTSAYDAGVFFPANDVSLGLTRAALAVLVMVVAGAIFELIDLPGYPRRFARGASVAVGCAAFVGAATLVPFAVPLSVVTSLSVMMAATVVMAVASALMARNEQTPSVFAVGGVVVLGSLWTLGWLFGLVNVWSTVATLGVGVGVAVMLGVSVRSINARSAWAAVAATATLGFAVVLADALGAVSSEVAFAGVVVAGLIVIAVQWLVSKPGARVPTEVVSLVTMSSGVLYTASADIPLWGAKALSVAVPVFALAGIKNDRRGYRWVAAVCVVLAWWAWLVEFEVDLVEAFTLPAAAVALGAGWLATRSRPEVSSWSAYGAGLVMGTAPSLAVLIIEGGALRAVLLSAALLVIVLSGVLLRLQAPVVVGVLVLLVLGIDTLWPVAAQVQRWILIAIAGAVLVWLGATFERRWRDLRRASGLLGRLD